MGARIPLAALDAAVAANSQSLNMHVGSGLVGKCMCLNGDTRGELLLGDRPLWTPQEHQLSTYEHKLAQEHTRVLQNPFNTLKFQPFFERRLTSENAIM